MIKKFKNGKLTLRPDKSDYDGIMCQERFYHNDMFMEDLYLYTKDDETFIIDTNKSLVYFLNYPVMMNKLIALLLEFMNFKSKTLQPLDKIMGDRIIKEYLEE